MAFLYFTIKISNYSLLTRVEALDFDIRLEGIIFIALFLQYFGELDD